MKKLAKHNLFLIILIVLCTNTFSFAAIEKTGNITTNETWSADTVKVTGDIIIDNGVTLTINPGVVVQFQDHYKMNVQGRLLAEGTALDKIKFTAKDTVVTASTGGWYGIRFEETPQTNDTSKIDYCHFEYGNAFGSNTVDWSGGAIALLKVQKVKITNCRFENNKQYKTFSEGAGILCYYSKTIITNNEFINNYSDFGGAAITCIKDSSLIANNIFSGNDSRICAPAVNFNSSRCYFANNLLVNNDRADYTYGVLDFDNNSNDTLINNTIADNLGYGITIKNSSPVITNCIIVKNGKDNLVQDANSHAIISYCNIDGAGLENNGNFYRAPLFLGEGENPYSLQGTSPCLNMGNPTWTIDSVRAQTDLTGNTRIYTGTEQIIDIGAYELQNNPDPHLFITDDIDNVFTKPDSSYSHKLEIYSYPTTYTINIINSPDGLTINDDTIKWSPNSSQKKTTFLTGFAFDNGILKDTLWSEFRVLGDNEYSQLPNEDIVWDADTIKVYGDLKIECGKTLTINPGVYVEFQNNFEIDVDGRILAEGLPDNKITFTAKDTVLTDSTGGWNGLRFIEIAPENDTSKINNCIFSYGNTIRESNLGSDKSGGALAFSSVTKAFVKNSYFYNNKAAQSYASGGAIYCHRSNLLIINNFFEKNFSYEGGALECMADTSTIAKNIFKNNSSTTGGSALNLELSYTIITNNLAYNNNRYAVYTSYSYDTLINNTFVDNSSSDLYTFGGTIVAKNCYIGKFFTSNSNSIFTYCNVGNKLVEGEGNISANPNFKKSDTNYYSLEGYSPCVNAGIQDFTPNPIHSNLDLSGSLRIDEFINGKRIDIGAFEYNGSALACGDLETLINENINNGALFDTIECSYYNNDPLTYFILSGNTENIITLESSTGKVSVADSSIFNYELNDSLEFIIKVSDGSLTDTLNYIIRLSNVNESCTIEDAEFEIQENIPVATVVGTIAASDIDNDPLSFSILSGNTSNTFSVNSTTGEITINDSELLDYESNPVYNLSVQVSDNEFLDTATIAIILTDIEEYGISPFLGYARSEAVSFVIDSTVYIGLGENSDSCYSDFWSYNIKTDCWTEITRFPGAARSSATAFVIDGKAFVGLGKSKNPTTYYKDFYKYSPETNNWEQVADFGGTARYDAVNFVIDGLAYVGTGGGATDEVKDFWKYNAETNEWSEIAELSGDKRRGAVAFEISGKGYVSGGLYFDSYSMQLSDVQEYDPSTNTWTEKIFADGINLSFYSATAIAGEKEAFICYGSKNKVVRYIPETNQVKDFGNILNINEDRWNAVSFILGDTVYFGLGYYSQGFDTYYQKDILPLSLPFSPTGINLSNNNIIENQNETVAVGELSTECFSLDDNFTYSLVSGEGDTDNNSFIVYIDTIFAYNLNFETQQEYSVRIKATNQNDDYAEKSFTITLNDVNEAPTSIMLSNNTIVENNEVGIEIGTLSAQDEDISESFTFELDNELANNDNNLFRIENNSVIANAVFNYDAKNICLLGITASDKGGLTTNQDFYIYVNDDSNVSVVEQANEHFSIYPNPASNILRIDAKSNITDISSIKIFDIQGEIIKIQKSTDGINNSIDVSDITAGVYYLIIVTQENSLIEKIIIE